MSAVVVLLAPVEAEALAAAAGDETPATTLDATEPVATAAWRLTSRLIDPVIWM